MRAVVVRDSDTALVTRMELGCGVRLVGEKKLLWRCGLMEDLQGTPLREDITCDCKIGPKVRTVL